MSSYSFHIKRIYDDPSEKEGYRVLVDRLWPRGVSQEDARLDEWLKEIAPSPELRKWFDHDSEKFDEFSDRYRGELADKKEAVIHLLYMANNQPVTLLFAAKILSIIMRLCLKNFCRKNN